VGDRRLSVSVRRGVIEPLRRARGVARWLVGGDLARAATEQASLRRIATLVAKATPPEEIFAAVAETAAHVFGADAAVIERIERDDSVTLVAWHGWDPDTMGRPTTPLTTTWVAGEALASGHPARIDDLTAASGERAEIARALGIRSAVATPIVVEGRTWGVMGVGSRRGPFRADTERRMAAFTELVATAIANAQGRADLLASRARIVAASDEARKRIERNLHDGAQQRLVTVGLEVRDLASRLEPGDAEIRERLTRIGEALDDVLDDLREISRGIHPAILSQGGLEPALKALARRSPVPVELRFDVPERLPEGLEAAAYYLVSEALTNAAKHAGANVVEVSAAQRGATLEITILDDGVGGADPARGSGLIGMQDRAAALGGSLQVRSQSGEGTTLAARLPIPARSDQAPPGTW
jgi:signal transduction histidine kinase